MSCYFQTVAVKNMNISDLTRYVESKNTKTNVFLDLTIKPLSQQTETQLLTTVGNQ